MCGETVVFVGTEWKMEGERGGGERERGERVGGGR